MKIQSMILSSPDLAYNANISTQTESTDLIETMKQKEQDSLTHLEDKDDRTGKL